MKEQGYGRFVFIASSAGMFGQPNSAHYAAAKAGLVGLTNVIAIEGEPHGILANTVLPFGYSRMVWETLGEVEEPQDPEGFLGAIAPEMVVPIVTFLASRHCTVTHQNYSACAGRFARAFVGLAEGWLAPAGTGPYGRRHREQLGRRVRNRTFVGPKLDLRRDRRSLRAPWDQCVTSGLGDCPQCAATVANAPLTRRSGTPTARGSP